jgi:hypothetical protein
MNSVSYWEEYDIIHNNKDKSPVVIEKMLDNLN